MFALPELERLKDDVDYQVHYLCQFGWMGFEAHGKDGVLSKLPKIVYDRLFQYGGYEDVFISEQQAEKEMNRIRERITEAKKQADARRNLMASMSEEELAGAAHLVDEVIARELQEAWWTERLEEVRHRQAWSAKLSEVALAHKSAPVDVSVLVDPEALGVTVPNGEPLTLGVALYHFIRERSLLVPDDAVYVFTGELVDPENT